MILIMKNKKNPVVCEICFWIRIKYFSEYQVFRTLQSVYQTSQGADPLPY
jgi:hypothetical protein